MLERKFLNRKVSIEVVRFAPGGAFGGNEIYKGTVTGIDDNFIELDNNLTIQIRYIASIEAKD